MRAAYLGHEALTFSDYIDLDTGRTLAAVPGGTYDVAPASGRVIPEFPAPWFTPLQDEGAAAEGDAAPPGGEEDGSGEHDEDPGDGDEHSAF